MRAETFVGVADNIYMRVAGRRLMYGVREYTFVITFHMYSFDKESFSWKCTFIYTTNDDSFLEKLFQTHCSFNFEFTRRKKKSSPETKNFTKSAKCLVITSNINFLFIKLINFLSTKKSQFR